MTVPSSAPPFVADFLAFLPPGLHPGMDALARGLAMGIQQQGGTLRLRVGTDQEQSMEAALEEGVASILFVFVTDPLVPAAVVAKAMAAGLKVYTIHRPLYPCTASLIVPNFYQGVLLANRLATAISDHAVTDAKTEASKGRVAVLGGPKILDDEELVLGCVDGLKRARLKVVNDPMVDRYRNLADIKGESLAVIDALMKDHFPFDGLVVFNDETLHDVIQHLKERELLGAFPIVSRNGCEDAIEWVGKGWTTATFDYNLPELGMMAAELIKTTSTENAYVMGPTGTLFDASNLEDYVSWNVRAPLEVKLNVVE